MSRITPACRVLKVENIEIGKRYWLDTSINGYIIEITDITPDGFEDQDGDGDTLLSLIKDYNVCKVPQNTKLGDFEGKIHV